MNIYFTNLKCNIANFNQIYTFISLVQKCVCVFERGRSVITNTVYITILGEYNIIVEKFTYMAFMF